MLNRKLNYYSAIPDSNSLPTPEGRLTGYGMLSYPNQPEYYGGYVLGTGPYYQYARYAEINDDAALEPVGRGDKAPSFQFNPPHVIVCVALLTINTSALCSAATTVISVSLVTFGLPWEVLLPNTVSLALSADLVVGYGLLTTIPIGVDASTTRKPIITCLVVQIQPTPWTTCAGCR